MAIITTQHPAGFPIYSVLSGENSFEVSAFGAQVLRWERGATAILFANTKHAILDGKAPIRGGAPVCFPYFSKGALMPGSPTLVPQHGAARITIWDSEVRDQALVFRTRQPAPAGFGPTEFLCELTYDFTQDLAIHAEIANVGNREAPFQLAIHSYWAANDPANVTVRGLEARYLDNLNGLAETVDPAPDAPHQAPFDRVYLDAQPALELGTDAYLLRIQTDGGAGAVLWNPGAGHTIADLAAPDFVCLESGVIHPPRLLQPGESHRLRIRYEIEEA